MVAGGAGGVTRGVLLSEPPLEQAYPNSPKIAMPNSAFLFISSAILYLGEQFLPTAIAKENKIIYSN
jgi:hypothetical protein